MIENRDRRSNKQASLRIVAALTAAILPALLWGTVRMQPAIYI